MPRENRPYLLKYKKEIYCQGDFEYEPKYMLVYSTSEHFAIKKMEEVLNTREWERGIEFCTIE